MTKYTIALPHFEMKLERIEAAKYRTGDAVALIGHTLQEETVILTVNQPGTLIPENGILVPDYSENTGLPKALETAGVAEPFVPVRIGMGEGMIMTVVDEDILSQMKGL